jgi:hypothetical protein
MLREDNNFVWDFFLLKFFYSEKATKFCEISTVDLSITTYIGQIYSGDFAKNLWPPQNIWTLSGNVAILWFLSLIVLFEKGFAFHWHSWIFHEFFGSCEFWELKHVGLVCVRGTDLISNWNYDFNSKSDPF